MKYIFPTSVTRTKNSELTPEEIEFKNWYYTCRNEKSIASRAKCAKTNYLKNKEKIIAYTIQYNREHRIPTGNPVGRPKKIRTSSSSDNNEIKYLQN
jgi:hypothetical protein